MSGWQPGRAEIAALIQRRHLELITGDAANGEYLLQQARQRLAGARAALKADHIGAFELAYDGTRQALTGLLIQQGLRPRSEGGHIAIAEAVEAQFGASFRAFNSMRRIRNQLEYPRSAADLELQAKDAERAISDADTIISAAEQLRPQLMMWQ